jgi:hypothetical protein
MKKYFLASLIITSLSAIAEDNIYLTCKPTSTPIVDLKKFYKPNSTLDIKKFYSDLIGLDLSDKKGVTTRISWIITPPDAWVVDTKSNTVVSVDPSNRVSLSFAIINSGAIYANSENVTFNLNRINGNLKFIRKLDQKSIDKWKETYGGELPSDATWLYSCISSQKPAI